MACLTFDRSATGDGALGVDKLVRRQGCAAGFALVAVGSGVVAMGTFTGDVTVSQELLCLFIVQLLGSLDYKLSFIVQASEEFGSGLFMYLRGGTRIYIERLLYYTMVAVYYVLWRHALFLGLDGDGHAVFVRAADKSHRTTVKSQIACIYICRDIHSGKVANMYRAICIWQGCGDKGALVLCHFLYCVSDAVAPIVCPILICPII